MNNQLKMIIVILISFLFVISCEEKVIEFENLYSYKNDKNISDSLGRPANDSISYFPIEYFIDSAHYYRKITNNDTTILYRTFPAGLLSGCLHVMQEPILTNYYLNKDVIRFTLLRSFRPPIIIRLEKTKDSILIVEKKYMVYESKIINKDSTFDAILDSVKVLESTRSIDPLKWNIIEKMLIDSSITSLPSAIHEVGMDGTEWFLEIHTNKGYFLINRWSPSKEDFHGFRKICEYILDLSSFKDEKRY